MKESKRFKILRNRPVHQDTFIHEWPEAGFTAMQSPYDPVPSIRIENDVITEMDGRLRENFDFIDRFIADYAIHQTQAVHMQKPSLEIARMLTDIHVPRAVLVDIFSGLTPAKITEVMNHLNVVEMMMAMQKMRARRTPSTQAHITNVKDDPVQIAADAAEGALRGFREEETTVGVVRYAPFNAIALLIGAQTGQSGVLTQCAVEEATELALGIRGFTAYAETISVYGTESIFIDGDDTPYSKAFLASAYASRGLKTRFTSGTGSEALMGGAEQKSMLYLEARCLLVAKGAGSQGIQNGSVSCIGIPASVPSGIRAVLAENVMAAALDLEVASSNDQSFTHSDIRRTARTMLQFLPGTDFIFSGYAAEPNYDNLFAGSNFDAADFDDYNVLQRDMRVDGGLRPVSEAEAVRVRREAAQAVQAVFRYLSLAEITDEQVEAVVYAHGSKDTLERDRAADMAGADSLMRRGLTGLDIVKALSACGYRQTADRVLQMLKQRIVGDYMQTSAILDENFNVISAVNCPNDYQGPGTGYRVDGDRWEEIKHIPHVFPHEGAQEGGLKQDMANCFPSDALVAQITQRVIERLQADVHTIPARRGTDPQEVVIGVGPAFATEIRQTLSELDVKKVLHELAAGIEEEGLIPRVVKVFKSSDLSILGKEAAVLSGSGVGIGLQSKGTVMIHHADLPNLSNLELFPQAPLLTLEHYRQIGKSAARYAKNEKPAPLAVENDPMIRAGYQVKAALAHRKETACTDRHKPSIEVTPHDFA